MFRAAEIALLSELFKEISFSGSVQRIKGIVCDIATLVSLRQKVFCPALLNLC